MTLGAAQAVADGIPWGSFDVVAAGGWVLALSVLALVARVIIKGQWVPRSTYDDVLHDRGEWRAESRIKDGRIDQLVEQNNILLRDVAPAMTDFMEALQRAGKEHQ